uniref:Uncharacterized protein n=1 Tax=uncultured prokaryote TaxID=198431 RepID=A0A0H5QJU0_9ZZZZ|nr:hypothetical protein [uncultured prokaryote]
MLEKIRAYIKENGMLERKDKIVIGVSGGALDLKTGWRRAGKQ